MFDVLFLSSSHLDSIRLPFESKAIGRLEEERTLNVAKASLAMSNVDFWTKSKNL